MVRYAGMGNVSPRSSSAAARPGMVSLPGIVATSTARSAEYDYALPPDALLVMHSDGLTTAGVWRTIPG